MNSSTMPTLDSSPVNASPIMNAKDAAKYLGVCYVQICALARLGKIPARRVSLKPNGPWKFHRDALDAWIKGQSLKTVTRFQEILR